MNNNGSGDIIAALGLAAEIDTLRTRIGTWIEQTDPEMQPALGWQFEARSKYFRPLTLFACHHATSAQPVPPSIMTRALAIEMIHNMTLIIDDILDRSETRRDRAAMHARFGELNALMIAGYITADAFRELGTDTGAIALVSELIKRLGVAECLQWRLRRHALGLEDWRRIAGEDTGSMFEICACLGDPSHRLRRFGGLLGLLYHGCDDVGDVRGATALGGGGDADLRDGILTLPAALAIRDPHIASLFTKPDPTESDLATLATALAATLPQAESYLDTIAAEAQTEAHLFAPNPTPLLALIDRTRELSQ